MPPAHELTPRPREAQTGRRGWRGVPSPVAWLCRLGGVVDDEAEPSRVGVALIARHEEVLHARGLKRDQESRFVATHDEAVRNVVGKRRVGPRLDVDALVADGRRDRALEDVERLVLTGVGMARRLVAGADVQLDDRPVAARLLAGELELGRRAVAVGVGTSCTGAGQDGLVQGHAWLLGWSGCSDG